MSTEEDKYLADLGALEEIGEAECWRLLASQPVGRIAVNVGQYPLIFPVNHSVAAHGVVFRTAPGSKLWATHRSNVSFEVDAVDQADRSGWSVLVRGSAREIASDTANPELVELIQASAPQPWAPGDRQHLVRIVADSISGRRIRPAAEKKAST
jgi:nitroimidazol reductase NimA-like FMN-containing flavoprotein (pyridoxamine 5'-phosphate oxidase superfamily)